MWVLEANDLNLRLTQEGNVYYSEPGVACLDRKNGDRFGDEAFAQLFDQPRQRLSTAWQAMNQEACQQRGRDIRSNSDAVSNQVQAIFKPNRRELDDKGWVVVPGDLSQTQIGLLYGILEYARLKPLGFLDATVPIVNRSGLPSTFAYVEIYLHRMVVTLLSHQHSRVAVEKATTLSQTGYLEVIERWLHRLSSLYLNTSRFDLHVSGATEQQAVDQFHAAALQDSTEVEFEIEHNGQNHQLSVPVSEFVETTEDFYSRVAHECRSGELVIIGPEASQLPGIVPFLEQRGFPVATTPAAEVNAAVVSLAEALQTDEVDLHKSFPVLSESPVPDQGLPAQIDKTPDNPTHRLEHAIAYPIEEQEDLLVDNERICTLSLKGSVLTLTPFNSGTVRVNEAITLEPRLIFPGDRLLIHNDDGVSRELTIICVSERG